MLAHVLQHVLLLLLNLNNGSPLDDVDNNIDTASACISSYLA
jgi:hypothetical protein